MSAYRPMLSLALLLAATPIAFADSDGGIPEKLIGEFTKLELEGPRRALADVIASSDLHSVALNRERLIQHRDIVSHRIKTGSVTHQKSSGRCWIFSGFNVLRPELIRRYKLKDFEFSESFVHFWDKMEKSNLFLQGMIDLADRPLDDRRIESLLDEPLGDGGWWTSFTDLIQKYGVVPKEMMPETHNSSATWMMNKLLEIKLKEFGLDLRDRARDGAKEKELRRRKHEALAEIYRLLVLNLGRPPQEFTWRYETEDSTSIATYPEPLTPQSFLEDVVAADLTAYVALFNLPGKDYFKNYTLEMSRNMYDRPEFTVLNLPIDTLRAYTLKSILDSTAVWVACDIGQENHRAEGVLALDIYNYELLYETTFDLPKRDLIRLGLIGPSHAMAFVGADTIGPRVEKWLVENSWGGEAGDGGLWYMYNDWFDRYVWGVIIHERYLSEALIALSREEPILLPPWDPLSALGRPR